MTLEFENAKGRTIEEMRDNFRETDLWKRGDARLVWVNEGDLFMQMLETDGFTKKEQP